ncbi:MAG: rRNA maturation RNase YbeY [Bacteroidales bacterium]
MITYINNNIKFNFTHKRLCTKWIKEVVNQLSISNLGIGNINIVFCSDDYILSVNNQFLKHNYYTDIITFDYSHNNLLSGDLIISIDTVKENSLLYETTFREELNRVIIHGILHLMGYKDCTKQEKEVMRKKEDLALSLLKNMKI